MAAVPKSTQTAATAKPLDGAAILKDLVLSAILATVILGPIVGLKTVTATGTLALEQRWGTMPDAIRRDGGSKAMIDLRLANAAILARSGVGHVVSIGPCTRCAATEFFSHRSSGGLTGRQWSFIGWRF